MSGPICLLLVSPEQSSLPTVERSLYFELFLNCGNLVMFLQFSTVTLPCCVYCWQFVDEKIPWAHLDIAGPVWNEKKGGATGFAVQTLVQWVQGYAASKA